MTSDKFYFPPSWRLCAGLGQTAKLRRGNPMGQANLPPFAVTPISRFARSCIAGTSEGVPSDFPTGFFRNAESNLAPRSHEGLA